MKNFFMKICAFFCKKFANANYKYERLKEPKRFYVAMGVGMGPFVVLELFATFTQNAGFEALAWVWISIMICLRFWWVKGSLKSWFNGNPEG